MTSFSIVHRTVSHGLQDAQSDYQANWLQDVGTRVGQMLRRLADIGRSAFDR